MKRIVQDGALLFIFIVITAAIWMQFTFVSNRSESVSATEPPPKSIVVFAAAGTTAAMQDIAVIYEQQHGVKVQLNLASSAVLAKQIEAGADWDVFISANRQWMNYVLEHKSLDANSVVNLLKDQLALIVPADTNDTVFSIDNPSFAINFKGQLSLGDPNSVPAGIYAKQTLEKLGWWQYLSNKVIPAVDVVAAQRYVEAGQCQAGIVYLSGVKKSSKAKILHIFDETLHDPIYFIGIANNGCDQGKLFLDFLTNSAGAVESFKRHGFEIPIPSKTSGG